MQQLGEYLRDRVGELRSLALRGDPWVFLCASAFIEYMAKMVQGEARGASGYKDFLKDVFFEVCPEYAKFRYRSRQMDLADQMYHVLRCGIVHSFSLVVDSAAEKGGGRDRSILLAHRMNGAAHLQPYEGSIDAVIFTAEDFVEDIGMVVEFIIEQSQSRDGQALSRNIQRWTDKHPPILGRFPIQPSSPEAQGN